MGIGRISAREFVERMTLPLWQAAAVVRWLEGRVENVPKPTEVSPAKAALTDGDCVSQEILLTALHAHYPWVEIEAEEDTPTAQRFSANRTPDRVLIEMARAARKSAATRWSRYAISRMSWRYVRRVFKSLAAGPTASRNFFRP